MFFPQLALQHTSRFLRLHNCIRDILEQAPITSAKTLLALLSATALHAQVQDEIPRSRLTRTDVIRCKYKRTSNAARVRPLLPRTLGTRTSVAVLKPEMIQLQAPRPPSVPYRHSHTRDCRMIPESRTWRPGSVHPHACEKSLPLTLWHDPGAAHKA